MGLNFKISLFSKGVLKLKKFFKRVVLSLFSIILVFSGSVNASSIMNLYWYKDIFDMKIEALRIGNDSKNSEIQCQLFFVLRKIIDYVIDKTQYFWMLKSDALNIVRFYIEVLDVCSSFKEDWKFEMYKFIYYKKTDLELYELASCANQMVSEEFMKDIKIPVGNYNSVCFQEFNNVLVNFIHDKLSNKPNNQPSDSEKTKTCLDEKSGKFEIHGYDIRNLNRVCSENFIAKLLPTERYEHILALENFKFPFMMTGYPQELKPIFKYIESEKIEKNTYPAIRLAMQLFIGLDNLHSRGVFYGGVFPCNILVDQHGCLKISNFNNSMMLNAVTSELMDFNNLMAIDIESARKIVKEFLISSDSEIGIEYKKRLAEKSNGVPRKICGAKAHLEILRTL